MASPEEMREAMVKNLPEKTGKGLGEWLALLADGSPEKHGQIVSYLKSEHGLTHGFANLIAHYHLNGVESVEEKNDDDLIGTQYKGKEVLRPIYEQLIAHIQEFGTDLEISPKKSYVSLRRNKQFAIIQPSTKTRLDIGINLKGAGVTDRLENSGSFNAMVSHRVRLTETGQIDDELIAWLRRAYEQA